MAAEVPTEAVVRASPDRNQAEAWALVLEAMNIPHRVALTDAGFAVLVPPKMVAPAMAALDAEDREAAEKPVREPAPPDHGPSFVGLGMGITLAAFFVVTGPRAEGEGTVLVEILRHDFLYDAARREWRIMVG